jgi:hypothetical protein
LPFANNRLFTALKTSFLGGQVFMPSALQIHLTVEASRLFFVRWTSPDSVGKHLVTEQEMPFFLIAQTNGLIPEFFPGRTLQQQGI